MTTKKSKNSTEKNAVSKEVSNEVKDSNIKRNSKRRRVGTNKTKSTPESTSCKSKKSSRKVDVLPERESLHDALDKGINLVDAVFDVIKLFW